MIRRILLSTGALIFAARCTFAQEPGLIGLANQHPLELFHRQVLPELPQTLSAGEQSLSVIGSWSNTHNVRGGNYLVDAESREIEFEARRGLNDRVTLLGGFAFRSVDGGIFDSAISDWDRFLGVSNRTRDSAPHGRFAITGNNEDGSAFDLDKAPAGWTDFRIGTRLSILEETERMPKLTFGSDLTLPLHLGTYGQDSIDLGVSLLAAKRFSWGMLFAGVNGAYFGDRFEQGIRFDPGRGGGFAGVLVSLSEAWTVQIDEVIETTAVEQVRLYSDWSAYLDIGLSYRIDKEWTASFLVRENPGFSRTTTDFTGSIGIRYAWSS